MFKQILMSSRIFMQRTGGKMFLFAITITIFIIMISLTIFYQCYMIKSCPLRCADFRVFKFWFMYIQKMCFLFKVKHHFKCERFYILEFHVGS